MGLRPPRWSLRIGRGASGIRSSFHRYRAESFISNYWAGFRIMIFCSRILIPNIVSSVITPISNDIAMTGKKSQNHVFFGLPFPFALIFPTTNSKFLFSGSTHSIPTSLRISSSVSAFTNSQYPFSTDSSLCPFSSGCHLHNPNSLRCKPRVMARVRMSLLNSVSPVRAKRAAPRDFIGTKL